MNIDMFIQYFFCFIGQQMEFLTKKRHVYLLPNGCLNMSAINGHNLDYIAESIHLALTTSLWLWLLIKIWNHWNQRGHSAWLKRIDFSLSYVSLKCSVSVSVNAVPVIAKWHIQYTGICEYLWRISLECKLISLSASVLCHQPKWLEVCHFWKKCFFAFLLEVN